MDLLRSIHPRDTEWLAARLRGVRLLTMGCNLRYEVLSAADIELVRRCWAVCELVRQLYPAEWPDWPRDLRAVDVEVFALAAFAVSDDAQSDAAPHVENTWPTFVADVRDLMARRFVAVPRRAYGSGWTRHPQHRFEEVSVPRCCAGAMTECMLGLQHVVRETSYMNVYLGSEGSTAAIDALGIVERTQLYDMQVVNTVLSYAGSMLVLLYCQDAATRVRDEARTFRTVMRGLPPTALNRHVRHSLEMACMCCVDRFHLIETGQVAGALKRLESEYRSVAADSAESRLAFMMGEHPRLGRDSHVSKLDTEVVRMIQDQIPAARNLAREVLFLREDSDMTDEDEG